MSLYCELSNEKNIKEFLKEAFIMKNRNEELKRKLKKAASISLCAVLAGGLAAGTYYLVETQAPEGFNKLTDPIKVTITKDGDTNWTVKKNDTAEDDKIIDVENSSGSLLPSTGGRGAIAFAVIAALLVFGVAVSFIRDKRKEA